MTKTYCIDEVNDYIDILDDYDYDDDKITLLIVEGAEQCSITLDQSRLMTLIAALQERMA